MYKRILIPLDGSSFSDAATRQACQIAKAHDAEITGLVVLNTPELIQKELLPFNAQLLDLKREKYFEWKAEAQEQIDNILVKFKNTCEVYGARHCEAELQGLPTSCILEESIYYDLIVMGLETNFHIEPEEEGDSIAAILGQVIIPVLAVPDIANEHEIENVLVALNGSVHSAQALRALVRLSAPYQFSIKLLISEHDESHAEHCLNEALEFLNVNGYHDVELISTDEEIMGVIERDYKDWADLIVAGVHSKHFFEFYFVGSCTKKLIETTRVPLLLG